jgi:hypothetical protein
MAAVIIGEEIARSLGGAHGEHANKKAALANQGG